MSVVVFIFAVVIVYFLYSLYKRDLLSTEKEKQLQNSSLGSDDFTNICTIPGCKCMNENSFFGAFMRTLNQNCKDAHSLVHAKPSPFQCHAFEDRFKSLEDVTQAIHEAGLEQCRLVIGIDFTASNEWQGRSTYNGHSLHHVSSRPNLLNPYQHVIDILSYTLPRLMSPQEQKPPFEPRRSCTRRKAAEIQHIPFEPRRSCTRRKPAEIQRIPFEPRRSCTRRKLAEIQRIPFEPRRSCTRRKPAEIQRIHAFGFGDSRTKDKETFPLNPAHLPCSSFDELQQHYKDALLHVILDGPTSYAPVINKAIEIVEEENKKFHILIIIADGQFVDAGPTAEAIIEASNHPLSIVVVGVGDGPWNLLKRFDDRLPQRRFDNFQFVEYNKVLKEFVGKQADTALALHVLMEIPHQFKMVQWLGYLERPPSGSTPNKNGNHELETFAKKSE